MLKSPIKWLESSIPPETQSVKSCQTLTVKPSKNHHFWLVKSHEKPPLHPNSPRLLPFSQGSFQGSSQKVPRSDLLSQLFQKFFGRGPHHGLRRGHSDLGWWMGEDSATKTGDLSGKNAQPWRFEQEKKIYGNFTNIFIWLFHVPQLA